MNYILTFLEGVASFISPCILPMLPIYILYFMGKENKKVKKAIINSIGFVFGFTIVFIILSIVSSVIGTVLSPIIKYIKIVFGIIIIILGLNYMEIIKIKFINKTTNINIKVDNINFFKAFIFGVLFSISWTPCIGTFLSSALLLIAKQQNILKGISLVLVYSMGLGLPFIISAALIEKFKGTFDFIKKHYEIIKKISGIILIITGIYMLF